jgi:hypothetical protein
VIRLPLEIFRGTLWVLLTAIGAGCGGLEPATGPLVNTVCENGDSDLGVSVSFQRDIRPIFQGETSNPGCACHLPEEPDPIGLEISSLSLGSYSELLAGGANSRDDIVIPGQPCDSVLWQKVSPGPPFGGRMPFDAPPFLSERARTLLADWIAEGALDN